MGWGGGPGWGYRGSWGYHRPFWPFRFILILILIGAVVSAAGGHFFWPIIPLFILVMVITRGAIFRAWRRGWRR
jgi:hypothetical protein